MGQACCSNTQPSKDEEFATHIRTIEPNESMLKLQRQKERHRELESQFEEEEQANALVRLQAKIRSAF